MERELPRYMIGKDEFEVDMRAGELRLIADRSKTLALFRMDQKGDKLDFLYDHASKQIVTRGYKIGADGQQRIERILLPVQALDPKFHKEVEQEAKEAEQLIRSGKSVYNHPNGIHAWVGVNDGKAGMLPMVKLYDTEFFLDLRLSQLRQIDNHANAIPFKALQPDEFHFMLLYDTKTKNAFNGSLVQARSRDDVKALLLPPLDRMIRDGIKRHEEKIKSVIRRTFPVVKIEKRTRRKGRGI